MGDKNEPDFRTSVQWATLAHARDVAGGVTYLARQVGIPVGDLELMLHGRQAIPQWLFLRVADYINECRTADSADFMPSLARYQRKPDSTAD